MRRYFSMSPSFLELSRLTFVSHHGPNPKDHRPGSNLIERPSSFSRGLLYSVSERVSERVSRSFLVELARWPVKSKFVASTIVLSIVVMVALEFGSPVAEMLLSSLSRPNVLPFDPKDLCHRRPLGFEAHFVPQYQLLSLAGILKDPSKGKGEKPVRLVGGENVVMSEFHGATFRIQV